MWRNRFQPFYRAANLAAAPILAIFWAGIFLQFLRNMLPRLSHISAAGMRLPDSPCLAPQCDFSAFWPAGILARAHSLSRLFNPAAFENFRQSLFTSAIDQMPWMYPPPTLLAVMPISHLPFETGFWIWSFSLTALAALLLRLASFPWAVIAAAIVSPAALWNLQLGQFGTIIGAALAAGLMLAAQKRPVAALPLALLLLKPQAALLTPIALLAGRHWRAFLATAFIVAAILALTIICFGWSVWPLYLSQGLPVAKSFINRPIDQSGSAPFGVSVFWMLRGFGANLAVAYTGQTIAAAAAALATWRLWRAPASPPQLMAITVCLALLATPYGYTDDMVAWSIALAAQAAGRNWRLTLLDALFWLWPALAPLIFIRTGLLLTPLIILAATLRTWPRATAFPAFPHNQ